MAGGAGASWEMMQLTKHGLAAWAVAACLLPAMGCRRGPAAARVDAAIAPLIPGDTTMLAGARLDKLKGSPFWTKYVEGKKFPPIEEIRERTGLDPMKDVWEVVAARSSARTLLFVRGKFGGSFGEEPRLELPGWSRSNYKGYYVIEKDGQGVMFLNTGVAAAGPVEGLKSIIDNRDKANEKPPKALLDLVETLPGAAEFWVVTTQGGTLAPKLPAHGEASNMARLLSAMGTATVAVEVGHGLKVEAEGDFPDAAGAKVVQDTVRGMVGLLRLQTPADRKEVLQAIDGIRTETKANTFYLKAEAPLSLVDEAAGLMGALAGRKRGE
jgi:hypothetical protein